eukprot:5519346-Prymnesium_polylepis.2
MRTPTRQGSTSIHPAPNCALRGVRIISHPGPVNHSGAVSMFRGMERPINKAGGGRRRRGAQRAAQYEANLVARERYTPRRPYISPTP